MSKKKARRFSRRMLRTLNRLGLGKKGEKDLTIHQYKMVDHFVQKHCKTKK